MDFDLTDDQKEIKRVAKELLAARSSFAKVREAAEAAEYDSALWQELRGPGLARDRRRRGARRPGPRRRRAGGAARGARLRVRGNALPVDGRRRRRDP